MIHNGKAAFINDEHGEDLRGCRRGGQKRRWVQGLADKGAQFIADAVFVPDGVREQALYAIGPQFSGLFSNLPAIFARNGTEDGLQVEQGMSAGFRSREVRRDSLMELAQGQGPATHLPWEGCDLWVCGRLEGSHAFLLSQGQTPGSFPFFEEHVTWAREMHERLTGRGRIPGNLALLLRWTSAVQ
jgi:hypothetical protein